MTTTAAPPTIPAQAPTPSAVRTTGLRRRLFSRLWRLLDAPVDEQIAAPKEDVFADLDGPIVEIGAGHGSNFSHYPPGAHVTAFEPNSYMAPQLSQAAVDAGIDLDHRAQDLRDAELDSDSMSTVVSVLTLCSVPDRADLIAEIHRILRPGGRFLFVEHIAETTNTRRRRAQRIARPAWRALFDGCDPAAPTDRVIADAGFSHLRSTTDNLGPGLDITNRTHWGVATK